MIKQLLGKAFGVKSEKEISSDKISGKIKDNLNRFSQFVMQKKDFALKEFFTIK